MPSTIAPVPSGEASSTTRISREGSWASIAGISRAMLKRSLYVGTMTSARSGKASPIAPHAGAEHQDPDDDRNPCYGLAALVCGAREDQLDVPSPFRELDTYQRVVGAADSCCLSVSRRDPARIEILRDDERRSSGRGTA